MKKPKLNPQVFLLAAQQFDGTFDGGCCLAIQNVCGGDMYNTRLHRLFFSGLFQDNDNEFWMESQGFTAEQNQEVRVLALLLAYRIAKDIKAINFELLHQQKFDRISASYKAKFAAEKQKQEAEERERLIQERKTKKENLIALGILFAVGVVGCVFAIYS